MDSSGTVFLKAADLVTENTGYTTESNKDFYLGEVGIKGLVLDCAVADGLPRHYNLIAKNKAGVQDTCLVTVIVNDAGNFCADGVSPTTGEILTLRHAPQEEFLMQARPNPFSSTLELIFNPSSAPTEVQAYTAQGKLIWSRAWSGAEAAIDVNTQSWPTGLLIVVVKQGELKTSYHKLIKQ